MEKCVLGQCIRTGSRTCPEPVGYRIRSSSPIRGALWPNPGTCELDVPHRCVAMSLAAKSRTEPGAVIQVIHLDSGQVVFQKPAEPSPRAPAPA